jgi:hypothetical protein
VLIWQNALEYSNSHMLSRPQSRHSGDDQLPRQWHSSSLEKKPSH